MGADIHAPDRETQLRDARTVLVLVEILHF